MSETKRFSLPLLGPRLELTALHDEDLPVLKPFFQDIQALRYYLPTTVRPFNLQQLDLLLQDWNDGETCFVFAIRNQGQLVGLINLDDLDLANGHAEIGIALTNSLSRGQGYAQEAIRIMLDYAFHELGLQRVWARIIDGNQPSVRLFEKIGFTSEGKLRKHVLRQGQYCDTLIYGLLRDEWHQMT